MATAKRSPSKSKKRPARREATSPRAPAVVHHPKSAANRKVEFTEAVGRRKEAVARVRWYPEGNGAITVNGKPLAAAFPWFEYQADIVKPLTLANQGNATITAHVKGGGPRGQSQAIRLGIARVLLKVNAEWRGSLKAAGLLKRDPRVKERKKYGLKRARRAPQWQKR